MTTVYYAAVLEKEKDSDFGVFFPDLPGCVTAGKDQHEAMRNAEEALQFHIDGLIEHGLPVPEPDDFQSLKKAHRAGYLGVALVRASVHGRPRRVHLTMDENLVAEIDREASAQGYTRSGFLAEAARRMIRQN